MRPYGLKGLARRIRVRSVLLSGLRKPSHAWRDWMALEMAKAMIMPIVMTIIHFLVWPVPLWLAKVVLAGSVLWMMFVLFHAGHAVMKLERRRAAWLKSVGYDPDLWSVLTDKKTWQQSLQNSASSREYLREQLKAISRD